MLRAVLDANVIFSAIAKPHGVPGGVLKALILRNRFISIQCPETLEEIRLVLGYPKLARLSRATSIQIEMAYREFAASSLVVTLPAEIPRVCRDPKDDVYLAAARAGHADFVVTGDSDLLTIGSHSGIRIVSPREFLEQLS